MQLYVDGVGLCAGGLPSWTEGLAVLAGRVPYQAAEVVLAASPLLPAAERRRTTEAVKLAMMVGAEAIAQAGLDAGTVPSVFTSSGGDSRTIVAILEVLASPERDVSPTRFHNSVHNAPAGYWSIATGCRAASISLCAFDHSFAAGLIEAGSRALDEPGPILLVAYDVPYPPVMATCRPMAGLFGVALVLSLRPSATTLGRLTVAVNGSPSETRLADEALEAMRVGGPAARSLPVLAALASGRAQEIAIPHVGDTVMTLSVEPLA